MMDETYIKMCREAKEIQELWEPKEGDNVLSPVYVGMDKEGVWHDDWLHDILDMEQAQRPNEIKKTCYFIPRQEDLQEIVKKVENKVSTEEILEDFFLFVDSPDTYFSYTASIAQLWLEHVMETCFGKQ